MGNKHLEPKEELREISRIMNEYIFDFDGTNPKCNIKFYLRNKEILELYNKRIFFVRKNDIWYDINLDKIYLDVLKQEKTPLFMKIATKEKIKKSLIMKKKENQDDEDERCSYMRGHLSMDILSIGGNTFLTWRFLLEGC